MKAIGNAVATDSFAKNAMFASPWIAGCRRHRSGLALIGALLGLLLLGIVGPVFAAEPRKLAFVVGVSKYQKDGLRDLKYAEFDAHDLGLELKKHGFGVSELLGEKATRGALDAELQTFFASLKQLKKDDVVLLAFSGHGLQLQIDEPKHGLVETPFFCPVDALKTDPKTLLSLNWVMQRINEDSASSQNLLIVDACRDNPAKGGKGVDGSTVTGLPSKLSVLFGSSSGTQSFESDQVKHGIFTYCLLLGLQGAAANKRDEITWLNLASYAMEEVKERAPTLLDDPSAEQRPNILGNLVSKPGLARVKVVPKPPESKPPVVAESKPSIPRTQTPPTTPPAASGGEGTTAGELREDNALKMKLAWCPAGKFTTVDPGRYERVEITLSKGFWLGQCGVTQADWKAVMGTTPWQGKGMARAGPDYPASYVSWEDASEFCVKLTNSETQAGRLPKGWQYRLPTEAQREYACRAGTKTLYYYGDDESRLGDYAWYADNATNMKEEYAHRVAQKKPNPWGLYDMHGNIREWCLDAFDAKLPLGPDPLGEVGAMRVVRGGYFNEPAARCNVMARGADDPASRTYTTGFRVALVQSRK